MWYLRCIIYEFWQILPAVTNFTWIIKQKDGSSALFDVSSLIYATISAGMPILTIIIVIVIVTIIIVMIYSSNTGFRRAVTNLNLCDLDFWVKVRSMEARSPDTDGPSFYSPLSYFLLYVLPYVLWEVGYSPAICVRPWWIIVTRDLTTWPHYVTAPRDHSDC